MSIKNNEKNNESIIIYIRIIYNYNKIYMYYIGHTDIFSN